MSDAAIVSSGVKEPILAPLLSSVRPDTISQEQQRKRTFPESMRWTYYILPKLPKFREWWCCYSKNRNVNGKFISWIYVWKGQKSASYHVVEHVRRKDAKTRATRLYFAREKESSKSGQAYSA